MRVVRACLLQLLLPLGLSLARAGPIPSRINSTRQEIDRYRRSGGYPKFPAGGGGAGPAAGAASDAPAAGSGGGTGGGGQQGPACGTRAVSHQPRHSGAPYPKIVGGSNAPYGSYPWQVEIQMLEAESGAFKHHCGGAVVSERLVVSAAHCLQDADAANLRVVVGDYHLGLADKHEQIFLVDKILTHPLFRRVGPYSNDIGLIKVKSASERGIAFSSHVRSICLPELMAKSAAGSWCTVTGWGAQQADDPESLSKVLQAAAVPVLDPDTCRRDSVYGGRRQSILDSMLCAGLADGGVDACGGDSGGPLACEVNGRFVLMGVVSWGDGCAKRNRPGVYTRVSHYTDWIQASMKKLGL